MYIEMGHVLKVVALANTVKLSVIVVFLALAEWPATAAETKPALKPAKTKPALKLFRETNFGVTFNHSEDVTTVYDPHGRANEVAIIRKGMPIGGLKVSRAFPTTNDAEFVESGKKHYKQTLKASSVEYRLYENPQKYKFHVFKAKLTKDDTEYITESFVYHRRRVARNPDQATLDRMFSVFRFEFIASAMQYPALEKDIQIVIDTFRLSEDP